MVKEMQALVALSHADSLTSLEEADDLLGNYPNPTAELACLIAKFKERCNDFVSEGRLTEQALARNLEKVKWWEEMQVGYLYPIKDTVDAIVTVLSTVETEKLADEVAQNDAKNKELSSKVKDQAAEIERLQELLEKARSDVEPEGPDAKRQKLGNK